uniref:Serine/threonine-protein phosphatase n=1 Tax=Rhizophora mucronata TaxID=61149 RepID=A0A2P2NZA0_RHIMU
MRLQNHDRKRRRNSIYKKLCELQKIVRRSACGIRLKLARCWVKLNEILLHILPNLKYCRHIPTSIAIIWCTKYCHHVLVLGPIVSFHYKLVSSGYQCESISVVELLRDILSKGVSSSTRRNSPTTTVVRIRP